MSSKHTARSILEAFYAAETIYMATPPGERDLTAMAAVCSPDLRIVQTPALPYGRTFTGIEGLEGWASEMSDLFDVLEVQQPEIFEKEGSNRIVSVSTLRLRVRKTGEELLYPLSQVITVDLEKGQLLEIKPFYWDVQDLNRAVGHTPAKN